MGSGFLVPCAAQPFGLELLQELQRRGSACSLLLMNPCCDHLAVIDQNIDFGAALPHLISYSVSKGDVIAILVQGKLPARRVRSLAVWALS